VAVESKPVRSPRTAAVRHRRGTTGPQTSDRRPSDVDHDIVQSRRVDATARSAEPPSGSNDTVRPDRGVGLMLIFTAATLLMVLAVAAVTVVDRWWVLVPVMLLDFVVTFAVIATIVRLLRDDGKPVA
jgi:hypothetical protein